MKNARHRFRLVRKILKPLIILSVWMLQMFLTYVRCPADCKDKIYSFASESVPDPWYTGDFEETYQRVQEGCQAWLERLEKGSEDGKS